MSTLATLGLQVEDGLRLKFDRRLNSLARTARN